MARIRSVKPTFFRSLTVASLPISSRLTFIGLWTYADDEGRGADDCRLIKAEVWPLDDDYTVENVNTDMKLFVKAGLVNRYKVGTRRYFEIVNWKEHQKVNRAQESSLPAPCGFTDHSVNDHGNDSEGAVNDQCCDTAGLGLGLGKGKGSAKRARTRDASSPFIEAFAAVWEIYPRKVDKAKALKAYTARRKAGATADELFAAVVHYAQSVAGQDQMYTKYGATFFGPDEPFKDWVDGPPEGAASADGRVVDVPVTW